MPSKIHFLKRVLSQPETWWAITCLAIDTLFWLAALYRMEVNKAFPFLSISFVLVIMISRYHLNETISKDRPRHNRLIITETIDDMPLSAYRFFCVELNHIIPSNTLLSNTKD